MTGVDCGRTSVLILAAGKAERMGRVKALLPLPLLPGGVACSTLAGLARLYRACGLEDITVVSGFHAAPVEEEAAALGLAVVRNLHPEAGMFSSVRAGFAALAKRGGVERIFVQPVDIPLVRPLTVMALLDAADEEKSRNLPASPVLVPAFSGDKGHPPLVGAQCFRRILEHDGRGGLRTALAGLVQRVVDVPDALILEDMDTPAEYVRLRGQARWHEALSPDEAHTLLRLRRIPEKGLRHARAVGAVAARLAHALEKSRKDRGLAASCCARLAMAGGLLHDICKGEPHHEAAGGKLLESLGLPVMAELVRDHRDLVLPEEAPFAERELVYLADKYCRGDSFVPLEIRFGQKLEQYANDAEACAAITGRLERAQRMEARFARETGIPPATLARAALESGEEAA